MPRYFFHVHDGRIIRDEEGTELPDLDAARKAAVHLSGTLLSGDKGDFWTSEEWRLDVTDDTGLILFTLVFMAVVSAAGRQGKPRPKRG